MKLTEPGNLPPSRSSKLWMLLRANRTCFLALFLILLGAAVARALPIDVAKASATSPQAGTLHAPATQPGHPGAAPGATRATLIKPAAKRDMSAWLLFTAAFASLSLGALHALQSGHSSSTIVSYLKESRKTAGHALLAGCLVTVAEVGSVFALATVALCLSHFFLPQQLYPWAALLSGLAIVSIAAYMLLQAWAGGSMNHTHAITGSHSHWLFDGKPALSRRSALTSGATSEGKLAAAATRPANALAELVTRRMANSILPGHAALVVLLSALGLHRVGFGLFLISMFGMGLAVVLIGVSLLTVYSKRPPTRLVFDSPINRHRLPVASAVLMSMLGACLAWRGFADTGVSLHSFTPQKLGPGLFVAGLGLVLGMRHSTDADHVVAISTIVTRQRSIRGAAVIGSLWGLGHTLTIFVVGCLIILGGVVIPPRIGLSMEFSVGLMLIMLGVLNLTGIMQKIIGHLTPVATGQKARTVSNAMLATPAVQEAGRLDQALGRYGAYQLLRPLAIGLVHGLAGSAAVALLVLSTIHNPLYAVGYLVIFGVGTMLGMMCMTAAMAMPLVYAGGRLPQLSRYLGVASGLVSVCFGTFLVYQLGYLNGLFTSHPHWTPQ